MSKNEDHSSIRIRRWEKQILESARVSVLSAFRIGIQSLKLMAHSSPSLPCIYVTKTAVEIAPPAEPCDKGQPPAAHCCPSCPVRNAMPKRAPTALQPGQKENVMIEQERPGVAAVTDNQF